MAVTGSKEPLFSWRRICFILVGILVVASLWTAAPRASAALSLTESHSPFTYKSQRFPFQFGNASVDNELIDGLTGEECSTYFPDLYKEIDRAVAYWKGRNHTITPSDESLNQNQKGGMRIMFYNNQLRILESVEALFLNFRALGTLSLFQRALDAATLAGEMLPNIEVHMNYLDDAEPHEDTTKTMWSTARNLRMKSHERLWLIPNFDFYFSPPSGSFEEAKHLAMQYDSKSFTEKIPKIVWRGNPHFNELRSSLITTTEGKEWADVVPIQGYPEEEAYKLEEFQYCRYAMTLYTEGVSFSGRLKFLMNCPSLLFVPEADWTVHYDHLLQTEGPSQNCVGVKRDWSDLEEKVLYYLENPDAAERIIANSLATFRSRYTTRAATSCYIRNLIKGYASVSKEPEALHPLYGGEVMGPRGISYNKFLMLPMDGNWDYADFVGLGQ